MPIDLKGSASLEKSAANSFCQSNSLYSFNNSKACAKSGLAGSKSSNCLTDGLIEDEELIEKLFPKCRPKSKTASSSTSSAKSEHRSTRSSAVEMMNAAGNGPSAEQSGANGPTSNGDARKATTRKTGYQAHYPSLQSRRIWNFMDISPSPSPPPISPVESMAELANNGSHHFEHHNSGEMLLEPKLTTPYPPSQERPSPVGQYQSPPSGSYERETFKSKSRFDINSLEVNRPTFEKPATEMTTIKPSAPGSAIFAKSGSYFSSNDGLEKSSRSQPTNHKHAGAHFRLDSLLLSPDEQPHRDTYKVTKLPNGIKKANRFSLDCDLDHEEDDVLFSRINPFGGQISNATNTSGGLPLNSRTASKTSLKESATTNMSSSANAYLLADNRSRDRSNEPVGHSSTGNRENSIESTRSKSKLREEPADNSSLASAKGQSSYRTVKEDSVSDNEANEGRDGGKTVGRNRIELAGGKEIFSSSRSMRSKRRSSSHAGSGGSTVRPVSGTGAAAVAGEPRRGSFILRHSQLYSVSMAADCEQQQQPQQHSVPSNVVASQVADGDEERPATQERLPDGELRSQQTLGNSDLPVGTGHQSQHSARAPTSTSATGDADQCLESIHGKLTADTRPADVDESERTSDRQAVATALAPVKGNEADENCSDDCHAPDSNSGSGIFARTHVSRGSSHSIETASSLYKSTMTLEDEVMTTTSPRVLSSRDMQVRNEPESLPSSVETTARHLPLESSGNNGDRPETDIGRSIKDLQAHQARSSQPPNQEQDLCNKLEQSVSLTCDQFARDLRKRLDKVSSGNSFEAVQSEDENALAKETADLESDSNSIKSAASMSAKSFEANERIARVIGSVPIAQYEGSPKRYGPKPGYPKRVLSTSSNNSGDYETVQPKKAAEPLADDIGHKSAALSSENGSPHSSTHSSTSSATFSSTDIHSSSSFSCPSNQKSNGFSNWNMQSRLKESYDCPSNDFSQSHQSDTCDEGCATLPTTRKVAESSFPPQVSCDEIVKTILSLPSGQIDTEDDVDEDVTSSSDKPVELGLNDVSLGGCELGGRVPTEPIYSSIASSGYSADPNKSSGYSSKRSLHSDDSESVTKSKTSISSNGCDRNLNRSATSLKAQVQAQGGEMSSTSSSTTTRGQVDSGAGCKLASSQLASESITNNTTQRNVPKTLRLENYPRFLEASQSFESTDSSYRSEQCNPGKDYYYSGQTSDDDLFLFGGQKSYPGKAVSGAGMRLNGTDCRNLPAKAAMARTQLSYTCLSPELSTQEGKLCADSTYESADYPSDNCESYSDTVTGNMKDANCAPGSCGRIKTMPVLEDGLSSGMPSSDEMDYDDEDEAEDDMMTHEHDLDEYVNEYNNSRSAPGDSIHPAQYGANRLDQMVNGGGSNCANYGFHSYGKQQTSGEYVRSPKSADQPPPPLYRCSTKTGVPFGLELAEELQSSGKKDSHDFYNGHHHHPGHHLHNHPLMDDTSRPNLSSPYENGKHLANAQSQDAATYNHDKFCISSQMRSISNSSSNNSSMSTVRNATGQLGPSGGKAPSSPPPPTSAHHHYHHYYHNQSGSSQLQQPLGARQNYPNLSSSPTSLSPNSPGGMHHQSSASSSSSSSHPASAAAHHYHQQQPTQPAAQSQEMAAATSPSSSIGGIAAPNVRHHHDEDCDTDQETDRLLGSQRADDRGYYDEKAQLKRSSTSREVLIEGVLFRARYLGSTQLVCDGQPTKATRMMQAEEAVSRIKAPEGETQPSTEVDLFISTEKIMVLNTDLKEIMMDHALRTISYIADIGDLLVLMARRRTPIDDPNDSGIKRIPKMICHVFESEEAQYIAQSIGQAFQVAYMEFLKANGIEDSSFLKEMDYQEVLNSQEIFGNELEMFAKREKQKEVIVPKQKGEILGIVIVESGWGSMLPTVVIANMAQSSPSARCGQLNIGDQIIAINGISLVGLPLSTCQAYVKNTKNQTAVKFTIVPCAPVVEVKIKRPDTKYQLGFSVQNGVICSLLRGGIAERGGVRVGHRIIEINGQSVVAVPHDRIVNLLATSVGEIHMKTMPTSMFRLLTGQDSPSYM